MPSWAGLLVAVLLLCVVGAYPVLHEVDRLAVASDNSRWLAATNSPDGTPCFPTGPSLDAASLSSPRFYAVSRRPVLAIREMLAPDQRRFWTTRPCCFIPSAFSSLPPQHNKIFLPFKYSWPMAYAALLTDVACIMMCRLPRQLRLCSSEELW